jgi:arabinose-5-phosphate isomerase
MVHKKLSLIEEAARVIKEESAALEFLSTHMPEHFEKAIEILNNASGHVVVSGIGKSGLIGRKISATLASTGQPSFFMHPSEAQHGDLGMIGPEDVLLILSNSGESTELFPVVDYAKRMGNSIVSISNNPHSTLAYKSDVVIVMPNFNEACPFGIVPTVSSTMTLALGDAIAVTILVKKGFTVEQFQSLHPGGAIGNKFTTIKDVMRTQIPVLEIGSVMQDAIISMTQYGVGCVGICDKKNGLVGIITDGDLRRHMSPELLNRTVEEVMTKNPLVTTEDKLCSEVILVMEQNKITNLFVTRNSSEVPVGIVHLHDIISRKII